MTANDVTNVEYSRMLKRNGVPQETQAYWYGVMPSLATIQGMTSIAQENKGKMRWLLVLGKPQEPNASAYTLPELQAYLKNYMEEKGKEQRFEPVKDKEFPIVRKVNNVFVCSINGQDMFNGTSEASAFAQAVLYITRL